MVDIICEFDWNFVFIVVFDMEYGCLGIELFKYVVNSWEYFCICIVVDEVFIVRILKVKVCEIFLKICEYFEVNVIVFFVEFNDVDYFINVVWEENMIGYIWIGFDVFVCFYLVLCNN